MLSVPLVFLMYRFQGPVFRRDKVVVIVTLLEVIEGIPDKDCGCLPFVRIIRLGRALINGKGFSKITEPTEGNGAYHLQFDFPSLFLDDERLETGKFCKWGVFKTRNGEMAKWRNRTKDKR